MLRRVKLGTGSSTSIRTALRCSVSLFFPVSTQASRPYVSYHRISPGHPRVPAGEGGVREDALRNLLVKLFVRRNRYFEKWSSKSASPVSRSRPRKCYLLRSGLHCCQNLLKEMLCALHPIPGAGFVLQCKDAGVIVIEHDAHIPLNVGLAKAIPELGVNCSVRVGS